MTRQALADRIVVYSDTIVAFALVNGFAFLITLADPDIRCSIAAVAGVTFAVNACVPFVGTWALYWLRGFEARLRAEGEDETPAADPLVEAFTRRLFRVRLVLIWVFTAIVLLGIYGATQDVRCDGIAGVAP